MKTQLVDVKLDAKIVKVNTLINEGFVCLRSEMLTSETIINKMLEGEN